MTENPMHLTFDEYQRKAKTTAIYPEAGTGSPLALAYVTLGLAGEAGEVANKVKKILRDSGGVVTEEVANAISNEAQDVQWYLAQLATELKRSLALVAQANLDKLASRQERGVLQGSGDDR